MIEKVLRYSDDEGGWIDEVDEDGSSVDRYYLHGNDVIYINPNGGDNIGMSLSIHCKGLEHYQALNEIALLNAAACLDDLLRLSPKNLEFVKALIDAELDNR